MLLASLLPLLPFLLSSSALTVKTRSPVPENDLDSLSNGVRLARGLPLRKPRQLFTPSKVRFAARAEPSGGSNGLNVCSAYDASEFGRSCSATPNAATGGTCCTDSPGGLFLLTQFWDAGANSAGPAESWTVHGLWPDNCDSSYEEYCDPSRERSNIRQILLDNGQQSLISYMDTYWKSNSGSDESFWAHEWNKHGTCISSYEPQCYVNYRPQIDLVNYFQKTVSTFQTLPSYDWLAADGIVPSTSMTYSRDQILASLRKSYGFTPVIRCSSGALNEIWYFYNSVGGVAGGNLVSTDVVGDSTNCPATGIRYLPKYTVIPDPPSTSPGPAGQAPSTVGIRGYVYPVYPDGTQETATCLISAGTWYKGGTCAGYTTVAGPSGTPSGSFHLRTSRGLCAFNPTTSQLSCASTNTDANAALFAFNEDGEMSVGGEDTFGSADKPSGNVQIPVHIGPGQKVDFGLTFVPQ